MAKQKKINKNLVAFLTIMGVLLSVTVVSMIVMQASQKDPLKVAETAKQYEASGDMERAIEYYIRAYDASRRKGNPDVKYYLEASRCAFAMGKIPESINLLNSANTQAPSDKSVLTAMLERYWELRQFGPNNFITTESLKTADKMLKLAPDDTLALLSSAVALAEQSESDETKRAEADARMKRVIEVAPNDARVVITRAQRLMADANEIIRKLDGKPTKEAAAQVDKLRAEALKVLEDGVKANPGNAQVVADYAERLANADKFDDALAILDAGAKAAPTSADMFANQGRFMVTYVSLQEVRKKPIENPKRHQLLESAIAASNKARELDPTIFEAYVDIARAKILDRDETADKNADVARRYKDAVGVYEDAIKNTVNAKSARALMAISNRIMLLSFAFDTTRAAIGDSNDPELEKWALDKARGFANEAKTQFPEAPLTHLMLGQLARMEKDPRRAVQAFLKAEQLSRNNPALNREANFELAILYTTLNESGAAAKYAEVAAKGFEQAGLLVPLDLQFIQLDQLLNDGKYQQALDRIEHAAQNPEFAADPRLKRAQAIALTKVGRGADAQALIGAGDDVENILLRARLAMAQKDTAAAEAGFVEALNKDPERVDALRQYASLMKDSDHRDAAAQFLRSLIPKMKSSETQRLVEGLAIVIAAKDTDERNRMMLEAIQKITNDNDRNAELFTYYAQLDQLDKAAEYLDLLEKSKPNDPQVLEQQFNLCLGRKLADRAKQYINKLAAIDADGAGGARFRGQFALFNNDAPEAIREFQAALKRLPNDSRVMCMLAVAQANRPEEAIATLTDALAANPRSIMALKMRYELRMQQGQRKEAIEDLKLASSLVPNDPWVVKNTQTLEEERDPSLGIARREELRKANPKDVGNLLRLCELYLKKDNLKLAEEALLAAADLNPQALDIVELGAQIYNNKELRSKGDALIKRYIDAQDPKEEGRRMHGYLLLARYHLMLGLLEEALKEFNELPRHCDEVVKDPTLHHAWQVQVAAELADQYMTLRDFEHAVSARNKVLALFTPEDSPEAKRRQRGLLLEALFARRETRNECAKEVESYLKDYPKDFKGLQVRMQLLIANTKFDDARNTLNELIQQRPNDALLLCTRGLVNFRLKRNDEALKDLLEAKALAPADTSLGQTVRLRLASLYELSDNQIELAIATHREIVGDDPKKINHAAAANLIRLYKTYRKPEDIDRLLAEYEQKDPQSPFWAIQLGLAQLERREYASAAVQFKRAYDLGKDRPEPENREAANTALANWIYARAKVSATGAADAVKIYESLPPESVTPRVRVAGAWAYEAAGNAAKTTQMLEEAIYDAATAGLIPARQTVQIISEQREWPAIARLVGSVIAKKSDASSEIIKHLRTVQAMSMVYSPEDAKHVAEVLKPILESEQPSSEEWKRAQLINAQAYMVTQNTAESIKTYEALLKAAPDNVEALNNLAFFKAETNELNEAEKYADRLMALDTEDANIIDTVGYVYMKKGRKNEAENAFRDALRLEPGNIPARIHLAELLLADGKTSEACPLLQRAIGDADKQMDTKNAELARQMQQKSCK